MREYFAGDCTQACDNNPNMSNALKATCDTGSQQFCSSSYDNLTTTGCKTYLNRVAATANANRTNQTYANPIMFASGSKANATDYYNALTSVIDTQQDPAILASSHMNSFVQIIRDNDPNYYSSSPFINLFTKAFDYCNTNANADSTFCSDSAATASWYISDLPKYIADKCNDLKSKYKGSLIAAYSQYAATIPASQVVADLTNAKLAHTRAPTALKPLDDLILNSITQDDLKDPNLILLRTISPYFQAGVDAYVLNLINGPKSSFAITRESLAASPSMYSVSINTSPVLYSDTVRAFLANMASYAQANNITDDPMLTLIQTADATNLSACSTGNPLENPICDSVAQSTGAVNAAAIMNAKVSYCSDPTNLIGDQCIKHINSNQKAYNINDTNTKMLNYCVSAGGKDQPICKPFSAIDGSSKWLTNNINNTVDTSGNISGVCGTPNGLSIEQCKQTCSTYPELCQADIQQKCSAPNHRYSTNTDFFIVDKDAPMTAEDIWIIVLIVLFVLLTIVFVSWWAKRGRYNALMDNGELSMRGQII